ncbi:hypothetical protein M758_7G058300 [Ceratodon purpureus]|uniref:Secreted protein n=1 Tax=Ceratodon purpureus TaxID=3225 RepID=A0A8T0H574_CERPU|nr:hypothetical protein KC19_7G061200 [Ceratodon purpureus]KAG0610348.1 hypothetical protein M758_7G058300 [Ceratodon purpureus]
MAILSPLVFASVLRLLLVLGLAARSHLSSAVFLGFAMSSFSRFYAFECELVTSGCPCISSFCATVRSGFFSVSLGSVAVLA